MDIFAWVAVGIVVFVILARFAGRDERVSMPRETVEVGDPRSIAALIEAGRKIDAIKLLRQETGLGLKEAKEEVERLARGIGPS